VTSQILNVVIVLIGIYIALSVTCSFLQEQLAAVLKLRPKTLAEGIAQLMSRDAAMLEKLVTHPLIADAPADAGSKQKTTFPSYIDARGFSVAFWQSVATTANPAAGGPAGKAIADSRQLFATLCASVNAWSPQTPSAQRIKQSAVALLTSAEGDYDKLLSVTDAWFNAKMDRATGWYKRNAQYLMIGIAFALAFGSGVDSLALGQQLFAAPAFTQATAAAISSAAGKFKDNPDGGVAQVAQIVADAQSRQPLHFSRWSPASKLDIEAIFGLLITAIAVSLGAPFWFDILKCIVNVRMAGAKPGTDPAPQSNSVKPTTGYVGTIRVTDNGTGTPVG
jgi:hypothetical protein